MFVDRLFLTHYSLDALEAAANAGIAVFVFLVVPLLTTGISEVFVGQHYGAGRHVKIGEPVWQMLWLALLSAPLLALAGWLVPPWIFYGTGNEVLETQYFSTSLYMGFFYCCTPALTGFFVGRGAVKVVTVCTLLANVLNAGLDYVFIFGWGVIPEMGVLGAALASGLGQAFQTLFFFVLFLRRKMRQTHHTHKWQLRPKRLYQCLQVGMPASFGHLNELIAHFVFFRLVIMAGGFGMTIVALTQSLYILVSFVQEGLSKGATAVTANLIGAKKTSLIDNTLRSAFMIIIGFVSFVAAVLLFAPDTIFHHLIAEQDRYLLQDPVFVHQLTWSFVGMGFFILCDGIYWCLIGVLTAAGDTRFIMVVTTLCNWLLYVVPVFIVVHLLGYGVEVAWFVVAISAGLMSMIYYRRYRSAKWQAMEIMN